LQHHACGGAVHACGNRVRGQGSRVRGRGYRVRNRVSGARFMREPRPRTREPGAVHA
jgi:hypothetical protein